MNKLKMAQNGNILARWQDRLDGVACSPLEFFDLVQGSVAGKEIPGVTFSHVIRHEGGWLSPRRIYLRIRYQKLFFDVSAFVVGKSLSIGWWLLERRPGITDLLAEIPGFAFLAEKTILAETYYAVDRSEHIQRVIHESILEVVKGLSEKNMRRNLSDDAETPMREIW